MPFELDTFQIASKWMVLLTCFGQVEPFHFAGATLGSAYELQLPMGGVVAHPPGSGPNVVSLQIFGEFDGYGT